MAEVNANAALQTMIFLRQVGRKESARDSDSYSIIKEEMHYKPILLHPYIA